jgi:hypothetical protein
MEEWKAIPGYEGYYEISTLGNVRSVERTVKGRWGAHKIGARIMKQQVSYDGYLKVSLCKDCEQETVNTHILMALAFLEKPAGKDQIDHCDRNPKNNVITNIRWVDAKENSANRILTTKSKSGEKFIYKQYNRYSVSMSNPYRYVGIFGTLEEAVTARDNFLQNGETISHS